METLKDSRFGALVYEFLGTAFITYGIMVLAGVVSFPLYFAMLVLAWEVSGGHFNPAISLGMWIASARRDKNLITMILMIAGQVCGAFFGVLLGYLALVDKVYQKDKINPLVPGAENVNSWVPKTWWHYNAPY